jgi:hypothetical protein
MRMLLLSLAALLLGTSPLHAQDGFTTWYCADPVPVAFIRAEVAITDDVMEIFVHEMDHIERIKALGISCEDFRNYWITRKENAFSLEASAYCASAKHLVKHKGGTLDFYIHGFALVIVFGYDFGVTVEEAYQGIWSYCGRAPERAKGLVGASVPSSTPQK